MTPAGFAEVRETEMAAEVWAGEKKICEYICEPVGIAMANQLCERLNAAVSNAVQEEREACAKMCDSFADEVKSTLGSYNQYPYQRVARAIRSRGK